VDYKEIANNVSPIQAYVDAVGAEFAKLRSESQVTLGKLIDILVQMEPDSVVPNLINPHSYRGYYSDLAFEQHSGTRTAQELLADCRASMGEVFYGWKGGEFVMGRNTPIWVAERGCTGLKLIALNLDGTIETDIDTF
jgi:hypothetical protein